MKTKMKLSIGVCLFTALLAPGINAAAHEGPSKSVAGTVSDAEKNAPGVPEIVVPEKKETLAEVRARLKRDRNSADKSTTQTAFQCPDGTILVTITQVFLAPPGAPLSPPPPGGYDKLPEASPQAACDTVRGAK
jgi:hypothetical protein